MPLDAAVPRADEDLGEPGRLIDVEELVELGPAHVGGDEPRPVHRLREDEPERRRDLGLALAVERARDEHGALAGRRQAPPERRRERLVRLVLGGAQRLRSMAHRAADVRNLGEHRQLQEPAQLPGPADPRLELGTRQHDERRDEERGEEPEGRVAEPVAASRPGSAARAASASASSEPVPAALRLRSLICARMSRALGGRLLAAPALERGEGPVERGACPVQAAPLGAALGVEERGGDRVRDPRRALGGLVGRGDVDDVGGRVDRRADALVERRGGLAGNLPRRPAQRLPRREQRVDRGEAALDGLDVAVLERVGGALDDDLRGRAVGLRQRQRDEEHGGRERQDDQDDQQLAPAERVEVAARLDGLVGRKRRRGVRRQPVHLSGHHPVDNVARAKTNPHLARAAALLAAAGCIAKSSEPPVADPAAGNAPTVEFLGPERLTRPVELGAERACPARKPRRRRQLLPRRPPARLRHDEAVPARRRSRAPPARTPPAARGGRGQPRPPHGRRSRATLTVEASGSDIVDASPGASFARARRRSRGATSPSASHPAATA